ncbi:MAG: hypothetical protein JSV86_10615 [Gemmatimonadota bacterium]|nr:MAG: hypothetical protein JSV86_10615 [Gemmatimonadota bacterium]
MQRKLAPLGVGVVLGGSFRSGLAIPPRPGEPWDVDLRFLYDGDRAKMAKKIERLTGLTHRKTLNVVHGKKPVDLRLIEGTVTRNGATFEIEGALRDSEYFGIQALYPKLLTPAELRHARKQKLALRDDYPAYKAFKNNLLETVRRRAKAQGMLPSHLAGARQRKMVGRFCERTKTPKSQFDPRSFRYKKSGSSWILIGCPKGQWQPRKQRCKVGTRAHKILRNVCPTCRCKKGEKQKTKGR